MAVESESGKIYVGICVDTSCMLGIYAERNALFNMITNGENIFANSCAKKFRMLIPIMILAKK